MSEPLQVTYAKNPSQRTPCVLLLDTSGSMAGAPIAEVNNGLKQLEKALKADSVASVRVQVMIIEFGNGVRVRQNWVDAAEFNAPTLTAEGSTPLGEGALLALSEIHNVKRELDRAGVGYNRPWLFLMTDGLPTDEWEGAADGVRDAIADKHLVLFPFAVAGASPDTLVRFQQPGREVYHKIDKTDFGKLFQWLSNSMATTSKAASGAGADIERPPGEFITVPT